jgi:hypothetical protein
LGHSVRNSNVHPVYGSLTRLIGRIFSLIKSLKFQ